MTAIADDTTSPDGTHLAASVKMRLRIKPAIGSFRFQRQAPDTPRAHTGYMVRIPKAKDGERGP